MVAKEVTSSTPHSSMDTDNEMLTSPRKVITERSTFIVSTKSRTNSSIDSSSSPMSFRRKFLFQNFIKIGQVVQILFKTNLVSLAENIA